MQMKIEKELLKKELESLKLIKLDQVTFILITAEIERLNRVNSALEQDTNSWKERCLEAEKELKRIAPEEHPPQKDYLDLQNGHQSGQESGVKLEDDYRFQNENVPSYN